ncbi:MAG TPA: MarR family transcriptional regulator [Pirellulales bacterium]|nr:MarR family transcriptional regulator [Pirellulales bacterium]
MSTPKTGRPPAGGKKTRSKAAAAHGSRQGVMARLWELGRVMSTQTVFLHQAIAQGVGLNATDTKCLDLVLRGPADAVTAGWLSEMTGLTTGAVTHILDRLEKRGFVERRRDDRDRRKVFIRPRPEAVEPLVPKYEAVGRAYVELLESYSDQDLQLICDYLERVSALSQRELTRVIAENRAASE